MPPLQAEVPLWLAVALKKNRKCTIVPPTWLSKGQFQFRSVQCSSIWTLINLKLAFILTHVFRSMFTTVCACMHAMEIDHLQETLLLEESSADLVKVPFHYMEIVHMLFDV